MISFLVLYLFAIVFTLRDYLFHSENHLFKIMFFRTCEEKKKSIKHFRIKKSSDSTINLKSSQEPLRVLRGHFDNHCIRIKPQKYKILSLV